MTTHEIVASPVEFARLENDWNELWRRAHGAVFKAIPGSAHGCTGTPLRPKWRLHVAVARRDGQVAAILPLAVRRHHGVRVLEFAAQRFSD